MMKRSSAERQVLDVEEVVLQLLQRVLDARAVGVADLRPAGQAGPDDVALAVERNLPRELPDELRPLGPRSDQAHVADAARSRAAAARRAASGAGSGRSASRAVVVLAAHTAPVVASASCRIERNLWTVKTCPCWPTRCWSVEDRPGRRQLHEHRDDAHQRRRTSSSRGRAPIDVERRASPRDRRRALPEALGENQPARSQVLDRDLAGVLLVDRRQVIEA